MITPVPALQLMAIGATVEQVARSMTVARSRLSQILSGRCDPSGRESRSLATLLATPVPLDHGRLVPAEAFQRAADWARRGGFEQACYEMRAVGIQLRFRPNLIVGTSDMHIPVETCLALRR